jgi:8-oxo-dGTP pyrophosphatase MutT (NUDIX family)
MTKDEHFMVHSAVFICLFDSNGHVLLHRRYNTGYGDGRYDMPSGHVEVDERLVDAAARELREETGIVLPPESLHLWHINQFAANGEHYYNFFFEADKWSGKPSITEPDKCDDMDFFALNKLPLLTAGSYVALRHYPEAGVTLDYIDQSRYDEIMKS